MNPELITEILRHWKIILSCIIIKCPNSRLMIGKQNDKERRVTLLTLFLNTLSKVTWGHFWTPQQQRKVFDHGALAFRPSCAPIKSHKHKGKHGHHGSKARKLSRGANNGPLKTKTNVITSGQSEQTQIERF